MAEYWKSTPSYWCKFCSTYVKDTPIERKNHESSFKHQNNIQRGLRDLHRNKERQDRDLQRAKNEVARLNGLVDGKPAGHGGKPGIIGLIDKGKAGAAQGQKISSSEQRKLHAEQLLALGVQLPEELKREVQGVGSWQVVSERVIDDEQPERSLADILKEEREDKVDVQGVVSRGIHKRKAMTDNDDDHAEQSGPKLGWGSKFKKYPGSVEQDINADLDSLLTAAATKHVKHESDDQKAEVQVKTEQDEADAAPVIQSSLEAVIPGPAIKRESSKDSAPVVFKKRKIKT